MKWSEAKRNIPAIGEIRSLNIPISLITSYSFPLISFIFIDSFEIPFIRISYLKYFILHNLTFLTRHHPKTLSIGRFKRASANQIRETARHSVGSYLPAKSLELKHTIKLIAELNDEISEIEAEIKKIMDCIDSPILSVPGIGMNIGAIIVAEIGDFSRFENPDKILAFAGCSPSTYQSGQLYSSHAKMEKRGSRYLRWALINAASYVCNWEPTFAEYLAKKRAEGKHYYVALSHAAKKLVRLLYHLETAGEKYQPQKMSS